MLARSLGTADGVDELRDLVERTGALAAVEADIDRLERQADAALDALPPGGRELLEPLLLTRDPSRRVDAAGVTRTAEGRVSMQVLTISTRPHPRSRPRRTRGV